MSNGWSIKISKLTSLELCVESVREVMSVFVSRVAWNTFIEGADWYLKSAALWESLKSFRLWLEFSCLWFGSNLRASRTDSIVATETDFPLECLDRFSELLERIWLANSTPNSVREFTFERRSGFTTSVSSELENEFVCRVVLSWLPKLDFFEARKSWINRR